MDAQTEPLDLICNEDAMALFSRSSSHSHEDEEPIDAITEEILAPDLSDATDQGFVASSELDVIPTIVLPPPPEMEMPPLPLEAEPRSLWQRVRFPVVLLGVLLGSLGLGVLFDVFWLTPTQASILLVPQRLHQEITVNIPPAHLGWRVLPPVTRSAQRTVPATALVHQPATLASGLVTLYNGSLVAQTIEAGTLIQGQDGVSVTTDETRTLPAGTVSTKSATVVEAHATQSGPQGNIAAGDLTGPCCRDNVFVTNEAFTGGQDARTYQAVGQHDMTQARAQLLPIVQRTIQDTQNAQLRANETAITPPCQFTLATSAPVGSEARTVTVTLTEQCPASQVYQPALVARQLTTALPGFVPVEGTTPTIAIWHTSATAWTVHLSGEVMYPWTPAQLQVLAHRLAGRTRRQALLVLQADPGIQRAQLTMPSGQETLPDAHHLLFSVIQYESTTNPSAQ